jgi:hypothetical protein
MNILVFKAGQHFSQIRGDCGGPFSISFRLISYSWFPGQAGKDQRLGASGICAHASVIYLSNITGNPMNRKSSSLAQASRYAQPYR